jgi:NTP pyrophosphatase (non-canonical NTP hydrolase)
MIRKLSKEIHENAREKGWWPEGDDDVNNIPEKIALVHSELSEALEEYRNHRIPDGIYMDNPSKPEGFGIELADAVIRIFDLAEYLQIDIQECIEVKMDYNKTRPQRHGGKRC